MAEPSTAAQLIDALLAGGEPFDEGSFSIDTTAAAAKLLGFQYLDRSAYLIPIAEAGAGLDAQRVSLTTHGEDRSDRRQLLDRSAHAGRRIPARHDAPTRAPRPRGRRLSQGRSRWPSRAA